MRFRFQVFLGIDQTGACQPQGQPRPLPVALLFDSPERGPRVELCRVSSLTKKDILACLHRHDWDQPLDRLLIAVDSVLGLPEDCVTPNWNLDLGLHKAHLFQRKTGWGREPAARFFRSHLSSKKNWPQRRCEKIAKANSVFATMPFQKNIGCGSFRIWAELGGEPRWFRTCLTDKPGASGAWLFEIYPSWIWKNVLGFSHRDPAALPTWLKQNQISFSKKTRTQIIQSPDCADAVVAALGAWHLQKKSLIWKWPRWDWVQHEGWILGLPSCENRKSLPTSSSRSNVKE